MCVFKTLQDIKNKYIFIEKLECCTLNINQTQVKHKRFYKAEMQTKAMKL